MGRVPDTEEEEAACLCGNCPSKNNDGMLFYCVRGESSMEVERLFCACNWCPLWSTYRLSKTHYCAEGAAGDDDMAPEDEATDEGTDDYEYLIDDDDVID